METVVKQKWHMHLYWSIFSFFNPLKTSPYYTSAGGLWEMCVILAKSNLPQRVNNQYAHVKDCLVQNVCCIHYMKFNNYNNAKLTTFIGTNYKQMWRLFLECNTNTSVQIHFEIQIMKFILPKGWTECNSVYESL